MVIDPVLKPRITEVPEVSEKTLALFRDSLVWDNQLPWGGGGNGELIDTLLRRFQKVGCDFASLSVGYGTSAETIRHIARVRREIIDRPDWLVLAGSVADVKEAQANKRLAVNFNFQDAGPIERSLDMIQLYYNMGVRQVGLAYNRRNLVGDGCAETDDAGLSRLGIEVVKEMNRVGIVVDGSHAGCRTTMEAMELCDGPFVFSHSNPFAVRPHYRNIKDEQIKACIATGGVVGINGVGFWVGDMDASTEAIFRCLDYTVELVGSENVGLGFDYIDDLDGLIQSVRSTPLTWPAYESEEMVKHNYAGAEQMVDLVQIMLDHGYPDHAIVGILGKNWADLCERVWDR